MIFQNPTIIHPIDDKVVDKIEVLLNDKSIVSLKQLQSKLDEFVVKTLFKRKQPPHKKNRKYHLKLADLKNILYLRCVARDSNGSTIQFDGVPKNGVHIDPRVHVIVTEDRAKTCRKRKLSDDTENAEQADKTRILDLLEEIEIDSFAPQVFLFDERNDLDNTCGPTVKTKAPVIINIEI